VRSSSVGGEGFAVAEGDPKNPRRRSRRGPAQPGRFTPTKRKRAPPEGCRSLECSGRRGIRTPCCFQRVSRPEAKAAQKAAHGAEGAGGEEGAEAATGRWGGGTGGRAGVARPRAHGATWRLPGPVARSQRAGVLGGHGSSLTRTHALGPTERLAEAIEFVSGGCHRCHRYRNLAMGSATTGSSLMCTT
jgi:hypothetical protein